jgi:hypothetical protein
MMIVQRAGSAGFRRLRLERSTGQRVHCHHKDPIPNFVRARDHAKITPSLGLPDRLPRVVGGRATLSGVSQNPLDLRYPWWFQQRTGQGSDVPAKKEPSEE